MHGELKIVVDAWGNVYHTVTFHEVVTKGDRLSPEMAKLQLELVVLKP